MPLTDTACRNAKCPADQWRSTLVTCAKPVIGHLVFGDVATLHTLRVLEPIWAVQLAEPALDILNHLTTTGETDTLVFPGM
jgi:hypothetical protein